MPDSKEAKKDEKPAVVTMSETELAAKIETAKKEGADAVEAARTKDAEAFAEEKKKSDARIAALEHADRKARFDATMQSLALVGVPPVVLKTPGLFEFWECQEMAGAVIAFYENETAKTAKGGDLLLSVLGSMKGIIPLGESQVAAGNIPRGETEDRDGKIARRLLEEKTKNPKEDPDDLYRRVWAEVNSAK